jgi:NTE family protein
VAESAGAESRALLLRLTLGRNLEDARVGIAISATDLRTGSRIVLRTGSAADAAYGSAALAGVVPPLRRGDGLIVDGAYSDIAPIDVARSFGHPFVLAVDPGQLSESTNPGNGLEVLVRAMEICHSQHAHLRFAAADVVLRPRFPRAVDTLDFTARRDCVAAGLRLVRTMRPILERRLKQGGGVPGSSATSS